MKEGAIASLRRSLPMLWIFCVLGIAPLVIGFSLGRGWRVVAAVVALLAWFVIRPWRFGLATPNERKQVRLTGSIAMFGFAVNYLIIYYRI